MKNRWRLSIEMATIIVGLIAFLGSFSGTLLQGYFSQMQQKEEFESTLIIKAVETGNTQLSKNNLEFLIDAGLITDKDKVVAINRIVRDSSYIITRGAQIQEDVYICTDPYSKKYHFVKDCRALKHCKGKIESVSLYEAKKVHNRELCGFEN